MMVLNIHYKRLLGIVIPVVLCGAIGAGAKPVIPERVFEEAGLSKLTVEELRVLEAWIAGEPQSTDGVTKVRPEVVLPEGDDRFGFEQVTSRVAKILQSSEDRIEAKIEGRLRGWSGSTIFHLSNGQRWQQIDGSKLRYKLDGAEVVLFRAAMGTYFLKPKKLNSRVRVRRLE